MDNNIFSGQYEIDELSYTLLFSTHALVAGATGSGKSTLIETFLYNLCRQHPNNYQFAIIDLKRISLTRWKQTPHCKYYATTPAEARYIIRVTLATMEARYKAMEAQNLQKYGGTKLFLIIDEAADLLDSVPDSKKNIISLLRLARAASISVIFCSQDPSKKTVNAQITQNITTLIALRCRDAVASRQIIGEKGAELLPKYGKALYYTPENARVIMCDVIRTSDEEIETYINAMRAAGYLPQPLQPPRGKKKAFQYKPLITRFIDWLYS